MGDIHRFLDVMVAKADPIPLILYNPPHAKRNLVPVGMARDRGTPSRRGRNKGGGRRRRLVRGHAARARPHLRLHSRSHAGHRPEPGSPRSLLQRRLPESGRCSEMVRALPASNPEEGLKLGQRIERFFTQEVLPYITVKKFPNMAADKGMAVAGGWLPGLTTRLRWPYEGISKDDAARLGAAARAAPARALPSQMSAGAAGARGWRRSRICLTRMPRHD